MSLESNIILQFLSDKNDLLQLWALTDIIRGRYIMHKNYIWDFHSLQVQFFLTSDG